MKKRRPTILRTLAITIAAIVIVMALSIAVIKIYDLNARSQDLEFASRFGLYHPVDVGGHKLNLVSYGNDGGHTIVCLSGLGIEDMCISYRAMTDPLATDNRIVFIDRAGYGLSDDSLSQMTCDRIVDEYRKALANDGIKGPYVLLAHSLSGVYATYWESHYPEDIEGVIFLDSTQMQETTFPEGKLINDHTALEILLNKSGINRLGVPNASHDYPDTASLEDEDLSNALSYMMVTESLWNYAMNSEYDLINDNCRKTWEEITVNDIPKAYICATWASDTDQKYIDARENVLKPYLDKMGNCDLVLLPGIHLIYEQRPDDCAAVIKELLAKL